MGNAFRAGNQPENRQKDHEEEKEEEMSTHGPRTFFTSFSNLGRTWCKRSLPEHLERSRSNNFEFTVASYNVLADQLMRENPYLYAQGKRRDPGLFEWDYRKRNLLKEIKDANADILCLQEVQEEHYYDWFQPRLQEYGYSGSFKKRYGDKPDGCATFFKRNKFSLRECHAVDFYKANVPLMDRNNVALILYLAIRNNNSYKAKLNKSTTLCVANTHLLFNMRRGDIKLTQLAHLFAELDDQSTRYEAQRTATLLCGDFNSQPNSPLYDFVCKGELEYQGLQKSQISGQREKGRPVKQGAGFGEVLFTEDTGLTHNCVWKNKLRKQQLIKGQEQQSGQGQRQKRQHQQQQQQKRQQQQQQGLHLPHAENSVIDTSRMPYSEDKRKKMALSLMKCSRRKPMTDSLSSDDSYDNCDISDNDRNILIPEKPGHLRHGFSFSSSYSHVKKDGTEEVSTCHDRGSSNVDYIFYSQPSHHERSGPSDVLTLSGVLGLLNANEVEGMGRLPNRYLSSDHLLLQASFILEQQHC